MYGYLWNFATMFHSKGVYVLVFGKDFLEFDHYGLENRCEKGQKNNQNFWFLRITWVKGDGSLWNCLYKIPFNEREGLDWLWSEGPLQ